MLFQKTNYLFDIKKNNTHGLSNFLNTSWVFGVMLKYP